MDQRSFRALASTAITAVIVVGGLAVPAGATANDFTPTGAISGVITEGATNVPLSNRCDVVVRAYFAGDVIHTADGVRPGSVVGEFDGCLDAQGRYTISGLPTSSYYLQVIDGNGAFAPVYAPNSVTFNGRSDAGVPSAEQLAVTDGSTTSQDIAINAAGTLSGTVADAGGVPFANDCTLTILAQYSGGAAYPFTGCTDGSGHYSIGGLPAGSYTVSFQKTGYLKQAYRGRNYLGPPTFNGTVPTPVPVTVTSGDTTSGINATLKAGANLIVHVLNSRTGKAIPGPRRFDVVLGQIDGTGTLGANGVYAVKGLRPETSKLAVTVFAMKGTAIRNVWYGGSNRATAKPITLVSGRTTTITVRLVPPAESATAAVRSHESRTVTTSAKKPPQYGSLTGVILDENTGQPLKGACDVGITLYRKSDRSQTSAAFADFHRTFTKCLDQGGDYRFTHVPTGYDYTVLAGNDTYFPRYYGDTQNPYAAQFVQLKPNKTTINVDVSLLPYSSVSGTVYDALTGGPIANICSPLVTKICTNDTGSFLVSHLLPNHVLYYLAFGDDVSWLSNQFFGNDTPAAGHDVTGVDIPVLPIGSVTITVDNAGGSPAANLCNVDVGVWSTTDDVAPYNSTFGCTDANGHIQVPHVVANGQYVVSVMPGNGAATLWSGGSSYATATAFAITQGQAHTVTVQPN